MFKSIIADTPFTTPQATSVIPNITGDVPFGDVSFVATLRALITPRMKQNESLRMTYKSSHYTEYQIRHNPVEAVMDAMLSYFIPTESYKVIIHDMTSPVQADNIASLELVKSSFEEKYQGWHRIEKITDFYRKQFFVLSYVNPDAKSAIIFTERLDIARFHYLQCSVLAFLPWYFDPDEGVSEDEMALISSLRERTKDKYLDALNKLALKYDFRTGFIKTALRGFETKAEEAELAQLRNKLSQTTREIINTNERIGMLLQNKNDQEVRILGLEKKIAAGSEESEIMEYFLSNKNLVLFGTTNDTMDFGVKSYLEYFDEDMARSVIDNKQSYIYEPDGASLEHIIPPEQMEKLMTAIFIDQTLRVRFCASYHFSIRGNVAANDQYKFGPEFNGYMPNPHVDAYRCMGNYVQVINQLLLDGNYINAIEQCIASSKSLNFGDSTVMNLFMKIIYGTDGYYCNNKCIELPDGRVVKPKEAIEYLEEREGKNNEQTD